MAVSEYSKTREQAAVSRFNEIKERYRKGDSIALGEATPEELLELGRLKRELDELQALLRQLEDPSGRDPDNPSEGAPR